MIILTPAELRSQWARRVLYVLAVLALLWAVDCHARHSQSSADAITQSKAKTTVAETKSAAIADTVIVSHRVVVKDSLAQLRAEAAGQLASANARRADSLAQILSDTTIRVHDTVAVVPAEVPQRFRADSIERVHLDSIIAAQALTLAARADETVKRARHEASQDTVIIDLKHTIDLQNAQHAPRCAMKCGIAIGGVTVAAIAVEVIHIATSLHKD